MSTIARNARRALASGLLGMLAASCGGEGAYASLERADEGPARAPEARRAAAAPGAVATAATAAPEAEQALLGTWYLNDRGERRILTIHWDEGARALSAALAVDSDAEDRVAESLEVLGWRGDGALSLRRVDPASGRADWYALRAVHGVLRGRVAPRASAAAEPPPVTFTGHVTGWCREAMDRASTQRTWDLVLDDRLRATLRIDRAREGGARYVGTLKVYASVARGIEDEGPERDIAVQRWDGERLEFYTNDGGARQHYIATARGRRLQGRFLEGPGEPTLSFRGARRDVLGYGLTPRPAAERDAWGARARAQVARLIMAGNPTPTRLEVSVQGAEVAPFPDVLPNPTRDDDLGAWPPGYRMSDLRLSSTLPSRPGEGEVKRATRVILAKPQGAPPAEGWPVAVVVNGHWGSAWQTFDPASSYWYGDAFARRGYLVVAVDVSHRPVSERSGLYVDLAQGDSPADGNGVHPSIHAEGMDTDWEEDGERAWDVMRALDFALAQTGVNPRSVTLAGLSMGGEVTSIAGALDPRFTTVIPAGFSPDVAVYRYRHHPCWDWAHADVNEYLDVSDYHAMIAPRVLVVETGVRDIAYSVAAEPFAADKQVLRRSRAAFADVPSRVVHFLHPDAHSFQVGDLRVDGASPTGVTTPTLIAPEARWDTAWQRDAALRPLAPTLFDLVATLDP
ncbi:MAG: hypothetical protein R3A48_08490 [Polyangiales bacterium]